MPTPIRVFLLLLGATAAPAQTTLTLTTADDPLGQPPTIPDHGFVTLDPNVGDALDRGGYFVGGIPLFGYESRNWFTFDLSGLGPLDLVESATLRVVQPDAGPLFAEDQTLGLYDVDTDPIALNNLTADPAATFADLGEGVSYGTFDLPAVSGNDPVTREMVLSGAALTDIEAAAGGRFTIGGRLLTQNGPGALFAAGSIDPAPPELVLSVVRVPEPSTLLIGLAALACGAVGVRR